MPGKPYKYSLKDIREWRVKAAHLGNNPHLSKGTISRKIAREYSVPVFAVLYHVFTSTQDAKKYHKRYDREYKHLIRHLDTILPRLYNGNSDLSLTEMAGRIESNIGIRMQEQTIEKLLVRYEGKPRGPPLLRTETGSYKLNPSYYSSSLQS